MKTTIFTLTSARSGTVYLRHLFQNNIRDCVCRHEPFFDWGNPAMFGPAIYDAYAGRIDEVRERLLKKRAYIERQHGTVYLESSHAFLKSVWVAALEVFPQLRLVHLVRDPMQVARSEAYREDWRRRLHAPFHYYRGDDHRRYFVWALTGNEEIFRCLEGARDEGRGRGARLFQWYFLQWIEIENRAMRFLEEHRLQDRCFTIETRQLNDPGKLEEMFRFHGLVPARKPLVLSGRKNRSLGYSAARLEQEEQEAAELLDRLPVSYLAIFESEPYVSFPWSARLRRSHEANTGKS